MKVQETSVRSSVRIVWMLTGTILFGVGLGVVWWPTSETIATIKAQAKILYDEANQNEADARRASQLLAVAKRIADDVRRLSGQNSQSATTAATLALLARDAAIHRIDVRSIVPVPVTSASPAPVVSTGAAAPFTGAPLEITVRGRFRDVLSFIADLPRHDVLLDVSDVDLAAIGESPSRPKLNATIHATVFRYQAVTGDM